MKREKDLDVRINHDWTRFEEQARAARSAYVGQLVLIAWKAMVRGVRIATTPGDRESGRRVIE